MMILSFHSTIYWLNGVDDNAIVGSEVSQLALKYLEQTDLQTHINSLINIALVKLIATIKKIPSKIVPHRNRVSTYIHLLLKHGVQFDIVNKRNIITEDVSLEAAETPNSFHNMPQLVDWKSMNYLDDVIETSSIAYLNDHLSQLLIPLLGVLTDFEAVDVNVAFQRSQSFLSRNELYMKKKGIYYTEDNKGHLMKLGERLDNPYIDQDLRNAFKGIDFENILVKYADRVEKNVGYVVYCIDFNLELIG